MEGVFTRRVVSAEEVLDPDKALSHPCYPWFLCCRIQVEPSELPRGFGVRWLVGNSKGKRCVPSPPHPTALQKLARKPRLPAIQRRKAPHHPRSAQYRRARRKQILITLNASGLALLRLGKERRQMFLVRITLLGVKRHPLREAVVHAEGGLLVELG